jgi:phytoene dehydrogenase-like protein
MTDVVVIGAGLNGLVAGAWLARRKLKTVILDARDVAGGAAVTSELAPGFLAPTLSHSLGPIAREVVRALHLDRAGIEFITPNPMLTTLGDGEDAIVFHRDPVLTAQSINLVSPGDAGRWAEFERTAHRLATVMNLVHREVPPEIDGLPARELFRWLMVGRQARGLGRRDLARLMRWVPMSIADVTGEWFEHDLLKAAVAAHAIFGNPVGPRSAGTGGMWLQRLAADPMPVGSGVTARGGPGAVAAALVGVATKAGAEVRLASRVARILTKHGRVAGVALVNGDEIAARAVVCAVDPRHAFLDLVDPMDLPASFVERMRHYRVRGVTAKVNLALSGAPVFAALGGDELPLRGRFLIAPNLDYLERAFDATKYGARSPQPWLELTIPTVTDPTLAPDQQHVLSMTVHFAPRHLREGNWNDEGEALYQSVIATLEPHVPRLQQQIVGREVLTPADLEQRWGLSGGHIFHGETSLDQSWVARPLLGWARHTTPVTGLFLAGAGTHPGGGLTGRPGLHAAKTAKKTSGMFS